MGGVLTVRALRPDDSSECARLHAQSFASSWSEHDFRDQLAQRERILTGAMSRAPSLAGFACSRTIAGEADLLTIVVDRAARGRGVGNVLLGRHLSALAAVGVGTVFLEVAVDNVPALALYRRHGCEAVGARKGYYAGDGRDAVVMRCAL